MGMAFPTGRRILRHGLREFRRETIGLEKLFNHREDDNFDVAIDDRSPPLCTSETSVVKNKMIAMRKIIDK